MSETYTIKICDDCAKYLIGMTLEKVSLSEENSKCQFCGKKKNVNYYKATKERKDFNG